MVPYCSCCLCLYFGSAIMLVAYFVNFRYLNDHLFGKELFILFAASAFRKLSSIYVFSYIPFGFEGRVWDLIVSVPDHCLSFYFTMQNGIFHSIISYWFKILESEQTKYINYAYKMMQADIKNKPDGVNWASKLRDLLVNLVFYGVWGNSRGW